MKLSELVGEHTLDAVDFSNEDVRIWKEHYSICQVLRFRLDGVVYMAIEDPEDGYRSCMKDLVVAPEAVMKNVFSPVRVIGRCTEGDVNDILNLFDAVTKELVLEVGTEGTDDYYPFFVAAFHPGAMAINRENQ